MQNSSLVIFNASELTLKVESLEFKFVLLVKALILSNIIVVCIFICVFVWKFYRFLKIKLDKRRKIYKKKRINIVNNPHSEYFEDF